MPPHTRRNAVSINPPKPSSDQKPLQGTTNTEVEPKIPNAAETSRKFKAYSPSSIQDKSVDQQRTESSISPKTIPETQSKVKVNKDDIVQSPLSAYGTRGLRASNQALSEAQPLRLHLDSLETYKSPATSFSTPRPASTASERSTVSKSTPKEPTNRTRLQFLIPEFMLPVQKEMTITQPRRKSLGTDYCFSGVEGIEEFENEEDILAGEPGILVKGAEELDSVIRKEEDEWEERLEKSFEKIL